MIELEFKEPAIQQTRVILNQANYNSVSFRFKIYFGGVEIDYSRYDRAELVFRRADGTNIMGNGAIFRDSITYLIANNLLDTSGNVIGYVNLYEESRISATLHFKFTVISKLADTDRIAGDFIRELDELLAEVRRIITELEGQAFATIGMIDARITANNSAMIASIPEAQAGTNNERFMTPARTTTHLQHRIASQAEAIAGTNETQIMTPRRTEQHVTERLQNFSTDIDVSHLYATEPEAIAGLRNDRISTPWSTRVHVDDRLATPWEAQDAVNSERLMTPARTREQIDHRLATPFEAITGTDETKLMTPQTTVEAIHAHAPTGSGVGGDIEIASETEAEMGINNTRVMTPLRTAQHVNSRISSQTDAEEGTNSDSLMTPQRVEQQTTARLATTQDATDGMNNDRLMTPLRVSQMLSEHDGGGAGPGGEQWPLASREEAVAGTVHNRTMTPLRTAEAIEALASSGGSEPLPLASTTEAQAGLVHNRTMTPLRTAEAIAALAPAGGIGTLTGITAGNGLTGGGNAGSPTIAMGLPSTLHANSGNGTSATSHTHQIQGFLSQVAFEGLFATETTNNRFVSDRIMSPLRTHEMIRATMVEHGVWTPIVPDYLSLTELGFDPVSRYTRVGDFCYIEFYAVMSIVNEISSGVFSIRGLPLTPGVPGGLGIGALNLQVGDPALFFNVPGPIVPITTYTQAAVQPTPGIGIVFINKTTGIGALTGSQLVPWGQMEIGITGVYEIAP